MQSLPFSPVLTTMRTSTTSADTLRPVFTARVLTTDICTLYYVRGQLNATLRA